MYRKEMVEHIANEIVDSALIEKEAKYFKHEDFTPGEQREFDVLNHKRLKNKLYLSSEVKRYKQLSKKLNGMERIRINHNRISSMGGYAGMMTNASEREERIEKIANDIIEAALEK